SLGDTGRELQLLVRVADIWEQKLGSPESATEILERILERDPTNVRALMSLAHIYEVARDLTRGKATLERAIALAKVPADAGELCYRLGRMVADEDGEEAAAPYFA